MNTNTYMLQASFMMLTIAGQLFGAAGTSAPRQYPSLSEEDGERTIAYLSESKLDRLETGTNVYGSTIDTSIGPVGGGQSIPFVRYRVTFDSAQMPIKTIKIRELLDKNPYDRPELRMPFMDHFCSSFIRTFGIPCMVLGGGTIFSAYKLKDNIDLKNLAYITAALGGIGVIWGLCHMYRDSNRLYDQEIHSMNSSLVASDKSNPRTWLNNRVHESGVVDGLLDGITEAHRLELADIARDNRDNLNTVWKTLRSPSYMPHAQQFYANVHAQEYHGHIFGGLSALSLATLLTIRVSK